MKMNSVLNGAQIAPALPAHSRNNGSIRHNTLTLADLLEAWKVRPIPSASMLKSAVSLLTLYLNAPAHAITIDRVDDSRKAFRSFLEGRKYKENSVRAYVNLLTKILKCAGELGWVPRHVASEAWNPIAALAQGNICLEVVTDMSRIRQKPEDVTSDDVDEWLETRVLHGLSYDLARRKRLAFWRLLHDCGATDQTPNCLTRATRYGIPLSQFPLSLKQEVSELLQWKRAEYSLGRPKDGRHRRVTSKSLSQAIGAVLGFAVNIRGLAPANSLSELAQQEIIDGFVQWSMNVRKVKGYCLKNSLLLISAAMHQNPKYDNRDLSWFKAVLDSIPAESDSEFRKRKAQHYVDYEVVEKIPGVIRRERSKSIGDGPHAIALVAQEELIMRWLLVLPWRQRNLRECRIGGKQPNLFKGRIAAVSDIDRPDWVKREEERNPQAEFWQFHFDERETKTGIDVHAIVPKQLIDPLEEFLRSFRPLLVQSYDPGTLLVNHAGKQMESNQLTRIVGTRTLRHAGKRITPHRFRDVIAYAWLKAHPKDYLSLSKMLWHANPTITIEIYGSRFNESSGVCAMEAWLQERESGVKK